MGADDYSDDRFLVRALRRGDEGAFVWLIDRYGGSLARLARSYVASEAVADEVVQETWIAVYTGIDRFEERSSLRTWLHHILANIARSRGVREHRSVPFASLTGELEGEGRAVDPDRFQGARDRAPGHWASPPSPWELEPEVRLLSDETLAFIRSAIGELPPNQQAVITLRDLEGWESAEVCNAMEISETNQRVLLHRARSKVRRALEAHMGSELS